MLNYEVLERDRDFVRVKIEGELVGNEWTRRLCAFLEDAYVDDGVRRIRLDLAELHDLDEDGLAALLDLRSRSIQQDKALFVEGTTGRVRSKLRVSGMLQKFESGR